MFVLRSTVASVSLQRFKGEREKQRRVSSGARSPRRGPQPLSFSANRGSQGGQRGLLCTGTRGHSVSQPWFGEPPAGPSQTGKE